MNAKDGKYYDGKGPVSQPIMCILTPDGLLIINADTDVTIAIWKKEDIFLDENHNTAMVLGNRLDKSKIELSNLNISKALGLDQKNIVKTEVRLIFKWLGILCVSFMIFWFLVPYITKGIATKVPYHVEQTLASKMPIEASFKLCTLSSDEKQALGHFSKFLYPKNDIERNMPVTINIADLNIVNAYTLPGGKILLTTGLLDEMKSPEELLGVMSHEIGHVVARDSVNFLVRGTLLASFFGYITGDFNSTFAVSPQILLSTAALTFDRDMEKKADAYAAERLISTNVTTSGLKSFFSRKNSDEVLAIPELLTTHPNFDSRIKMIKEFYPKGDLPKELNDSWEIIKTINSHCRK